MADRRGAERASLEPVAAVVQRLAVLLGAGVAPASSWGYLADQAAGPEAAMLRRIASSAGRGVPISDAILDTLESGGGAGDVDAWRGLAAAWRVATDAGAPLAATLTEFAASLRSLAQVQRELHSALAGPAATARLVMVLPVVGVLFGLALGFETLTVLLATPAGLACLVAGLVLMAVARLWTGRLLASARPTEVTPGLALDLMAIAVSGGASISRAELAVAAARERCGLPDSGAETMREVLELSRRAGVPAAALLRSAADEARRTARSDGDRRSATLGVTLMLPLGVCVLPAFMLLGVAPLLISVISSTVRTL